MVIFSFEMVKKKKKIFIKLLFSQYSVKQMKYSTFYSKMDFVRWGLTVYRASRQPLLRPPLPDTDRHLL